LFKNFATQDGIEIDKYLESLDKKLRTKTIFIPYGTSHQVLATQYKIENDKVIITNKNDLVKLICVPEIKKYREQMTEELRIHEEQMKHKERLVAFKEKINQMESTLTKPENVQKVLEDIVNNNQEYLIPLFSEDALNIIQTAAKEYKGQVGNVKSLEGYITCLRENVKDTVDWIDNNIAVIEANTFYNRKDGDMLASFETNGFVRFIKSVCAQYQPQIENSEEKPGLLKIGNKKDLYKINAFVNTLTIVKKELEQEREFNTFETPIPNKLPFLNLPYPRNQNVQIDNTNKKITLRLARNNPSNTNLDNTNTNNVLGGLNQP